ncbi:immunoglobulin superfamily DCC subclass member 4 [Brachionichthys hirsutus]|uniref:immunoglobulin superfamily DCC subclass member 4 n=1 Tax=Brachionichthys hirsutus TaxID=412623 RepID=UPI00360443D1
MSVFLFVAVAALLHGSYATLVIKGPTEPVLEGEMLTLECLYSDSELNVSRVHFEMFSTYSSSWRPLRERSWCRNRVQIKQTTGSLVLSIPKAGQYDEGPYRCVSDAPNATAPDFSSQEFIVKVHYMGQLIVTREGFTNYLGLPQDLRVRSGDDVVLQCFVSSSEDAVYYWNREGDDWILPDSKLALKKVVASESGLYTCRAEHPDIASLSKSRTVRITVLPADAPWYQSTDGSLVLMTSAAAAVFLLVLIFMSVALYLRAKRAKTSKGPIDDRSQKKPIYKTSVESLPPNCGDKQPLV